MDILIIFQIIVALGIYNVWFVRPKKSTPWRGRGSRSLKEEFQTYGLPNFMFYLVGFLKITLATIILIGVWVPGVAKFAALGLAILMLGAISMHIKVKDPLKKSFPAFIMLTLSVLIVLLS